MRECAHKMNSVHWRLALNGSFESLSCRLENSCNRIIAIRELIFWCDVRTVLTGSLKIFFLFLNKTPLLRFGACYIIRSNNMFYEM